MCGQTPRATRSRSSATAAAPAGEATDGAATAGTPQLFRFCQFDLGFPPGPADGRYLVRAGAGDPDVVMFKALEASRRAPRRRPRRAPPEATEPAPLSITRVTVVPAGAFADEAEAKRWLERLRRDDEARDSECEATLLSLNRVLSAQRLATGDPYVREIARGQAQRVRLGYGSGEELVGGRWRAAYTLPAHQTRRRRQAMLAPQEEVAAILAGRRQSFTSDELVLRARLDLDQGRMREAALQLASALEALGREVEATDAGGLAAVQAWRGESQMLAAAALQDELTEESVVALEELVTDLTRETRRRRYRGGPAPSGGAEAPGEREEDRGETATEPPAPSKLEQ